MKKINEFPSGWDERRVRDILEHYESQTDEEAAAEHETAGRGITSLSDKPPCDPRRG